MEQIPANDNNSNNTSTNIDLYTLLGTTKTATKAEIVINTSLNNIPFLESSVS